MRNRSRARRGATKKESHMRDSLLIIDLQAGMLYDIGVRLLRVFKRICLCRVLLGLDQQPAGIVRVAEQLEDRGEVEVPVTGHGEGAFPYG